MPKCSKSLRYPKWQVSFPNLKSRHYYYYFFFRPYFQPLAKNLCTCIPLSKESQRSYEAQRQVCHWHSDLDDSMMREGCIMSFVWKSSTKGMAARTDQTVMSKCNELLCSFKRLACVLWTLFLNLKTVPVETQKSGVWGCFIPPLAWTWRNRHRLQKSLIKALAMQLWHSFRQCFVGINLGSIGAKEET